MTASPFRNRLVVAGCLTFAISVSACRPTTDDVTQIRSALTLNSGVHTNPVTLDGNVTAAEWSDATAVPMALCHGSLPSTLYVKNDATDLYFAIVIENAVWRFNGPPGSGNDFLDIRFDNNLGTIGGENGWNVRGGDGLIVDGYNPNGMSGFHSDDTFDGGTVDFSAGITHTNPVFDGVGTYQVEYRGALDSADDAHDFSLHPGDSIGFFFKFPTSGNCNDDYYFPRSGYQTLLLSGGAPPPVLLPNGAACTGDALCASNHCVGGLCCDSPCNGGVCQTCAAADGATANGVCTTLGPTHTCREAASDCDAREVCNGSNADCPADAPAPAGTVCRTAAGACDITETCDGSSFACPADAKVQAGQICRPIAGACDLPEACDGSSPGCPTDRFATLGTICHTPGLPCEVTQVCPGGTAACPASPPASPTCTFTLGEDASRKLQANITGTATPNKEQNDRFTNSVSNPGIISLNNASPFSNTWALDDWTVLDGPATMTVGSRIQGSASLGHLTGRVQCDATTDTAASVDPIHTFSRGHELLNWSDQLTVTAGALPAGSAVQFLLQLQLDSTITNTGGEPSPPASFQTYVIGTATVNGAGLSLMDALSLPLVDRSTTTIINTTVGATMNIAGSLEIQGSARLTAANPDVHVTADASNTAIVRLTPITPGVSYKAASGRGLYAPDTVPPTIRIVDPDEHDVLRGVETVTVEAKDGISGIALIQAWAGSTAIGECHKSPCLLSFDTRQFANGPLVLRARARDYEGNVSTEDRQRVTVANRGPHGHGNGEHDDD